MSSTTLVSAELLQTTVKVAYAGALCYGLFYDVKSLKIPNSVSLIILALFFSHHWLLAPEESLIPHLIAGGGTFIFAFALYAAGLMGGGDVKLISALMIWAGTREGLAFLIVMSAIGGLVACLLLIARKSMVFWPSTYNFIPSNRLKTWTRLGIFPYGIAICTAGLVLMPSFFAPHNP